MFVFVFFLSLMRAILFLMWCLGAQSYPMKCVWEGHTTPSCSNSSYAWQYPLCSLYQLPTRHPIPCTGVDPLRYCTIGSSTVLQPASWHIHLLYPNPHCTNCSQRFTKERPHAYTLDGSFNLRGKLASFLNRVVADITGTVSRRFTFFKFPFFLA